MIQSKQSCSSLQFFDRDAELAITERRLPHWAQKGTLCFITWRTIDSIPRKIAKEWQIKRKSWLMRHGQTNSSRSWREEIRLLTPELQAEYHRTFSKEWQNCLDQCHGECVLRQPRLAKIVAESLHHFDGDRYELSDFVVMPNHVHLLATFKSHEGMLAQCDSWKHYTAVQINGRLGTTGRFWQKDVFDHLVRSENAFLGFRRYIKENPAKAGLSENEYLHFSKAIPN